MQIVSLGDSHDYVKVCFQGKSEKHFKISSSENFTQQAKH